VNVDDEIAGGYGHDTIYGAAGDDRLHGDQGSDSLSGDTGNDRLHGDSGFDTLLGGDGADTLDGGTGFDRLDGGNGDDVYVLGLGSGNDIVVQDASGADAVQIAAGLTTSNVALYRVSSPPAADIAFNGDSLVIQLNGGSDQLWIANYFASGSAGYVERIDFADGTSWDYAAVSARLASNGGTASTLTGTNKADTFVIDHWNDVLPATLTSGDKAQASVSYRVPTIPLASFTLTGSLNLFAVPSDQGYPIVGNAGDNHFESTSWYDHGAYQGGKGNDVYVTRGIIDMVTTAMDPATLGIVPVELAGEGGDTLMSGFWSAQLTANVENLLLIAPNPVATNNLTFYGYQQNDFTHRLIGNALDNTIDTTLYEDKLYSQWWYSYRNNPLLGAGTFRLDGGAGADSLIGGWGDDVYVIDNAGDTVVETGFSKAGYDYSSDTVETAFSASLAQYAHVENITLAGAAATSATGNDGDNRLDGSLNSAANVLTPMSSVSATPPQNRRAKAAIRWSSQPPRAAWCASRTTRTPRTCAWPLQQDTSKCKATPMRMC
jgi:Ca2+-binding RTX toxin-like protein